jgi:hypothetical protein
MLRAACGPNLGSLKSFVADPADSSGYVLPTNSDPHLRSLMQSIISKLQHQTEVELTGPVSKCALVLTR